jgi:hypothetical protein
LGLFGFATKSRVRGSPVVTDQGLRRLGGR